jgi:hypothetical protein
VWNHASKGPWSCNLFCILLYCTVLYCTVDSPSVGLAIHSSFVQYIKGVLNLYCLFCNFLSFFFLKLLLIFRHYYVLSSFMLISSASRSSYPHRCFSTNHYGAMKNHLRSSGLQSCSFFSIFTEEF